LSTGDIIGLAAGVFTTFSAVPQIIKVYRYKSAADISALYVLMFLAGCGLWLIYGIIDGLLPVIFWNTLAVTLNLILLIGKMKYSRGVRRPGSLR